MLTQKQIEQLIPLACKWAEERERIILEKGVPLNEVELNDARKIGVLHPEKVRLLCVDKIPVPQDPALNSATKQINFLTDSTIGLCLRYGIIIQSARWRNRSIIVHELTHTMQYERLRGFEQFLKQYLHECITVGYLFSPLEQEAVSFQRKICNGNY